LGLGKGADREGDRGEDREGKGRKWGGAVQGAASLKKGLCYDSLYADTIQYI